MKKGFAGQQRKLVWERDGFTCHYCQLDMKEAYLSWQRGEIKRKDALLTVDHVIPKSKGGGWELENLVTACSVCNRLKGSKLLDEIQPRRDTKGKGGAPAKHPRIQGRKKRKDKMPHPQ